MAPDDTYVVAIRWDAEGRYTSPPIGPFWTLGEAQRAATAIRKGLRKVGRPWQLRVKVHACVELERALAWSMRPSD
jgi:hypothetical protein